MKKMFAASLVAIMAVSAANAEIASVSYTDNAIEAKTGDISTLATTNKSNLTAAVNELAGKVGTDSVADVKSELQSQIDDLSTDVASKQDALTAGDNVTITDNTISATDTTYSAGNNVTLTGTTFSVADASASTKGVMTVAGTIDDASAAKTAGKDGVTAASVKLLDARLATADQSLADVILDLEDLQGDVSSNKTGIQEAKDAAAAASTAAGQALTDAKAYTNTEIGKLDTTYVSESEMITFKESNTEAITAAKDAAIADAASKDAALETKITDAYTAADSSLKTELEGKITAASGSAADVADDLAAYQESNDAAVAAAQKAADDAQADADTNTAAISAINNETTGILAQAKADATSKADNALADAKEYTDALSDSLDDSYVSENEMTSFKSSNTTAIATAKSEAITAAKTAGDAAYDAKGSAAAAQTAAVDAAKSAADATYQIKSSALSVGAADGAWTDLTKAKGYSTTGTHSLVLKNGTIQWEEVKYANNN